MADKDTKIVKGQAFVSGKSLVQDQIFMVVLPNGRANSSVNHLILINDIFEELQKDNTEYVPTQLKGDTWYWDIEVTDIETEKQVKQRVIIPRPTMQDFWDEEKGNYDLDPENGTEWAKYWKGKIKAYVDSPYNNVNALSPVEVTFPGTKYLDQNGNLIEKPEVTIRRDDFGDLDNLLMTLF